MAKILQANALHIPLADESVHCVVTSPPYLALRDYGVSPTLWPAVEFCPMPGVPPTLVPEMTCCLGHESNVLEYTAHLVTICREIGRVLRNDGTFWLNLGDTHAQDDKWGGTSGGKNAHSQAGGYQRRRRRTGIPSKNQIMLPHRIALALQTEGWTLRQTVVWEKKNARPESVRDRPTTSHEYVFLFSQARHYFYDFWSVRQTSDDGIWLSEAAPETPSRNLRSVWSISTTPLLEAHFAPFPSTLVEPMIRAGTSEYGVCASCGSPYERIVEREEYPDGDAGNMGAHGAKWLERDLQSSGHRLQKNANKLRALGYDHDNPFPPMRHAGWQKSCACTTDERRRATVLDPFGGSGTTAIVANNLGRDAVLLDLSDQYTDMARRRTRTDFSNGVDADLGLNADSLPLFQWTRQQGE